VPFHCFTFATILQPFCNYRQKYSVALVLPDQWKGREAMYMGNILLNTLGFKELFVHKVGSGVREKE
jgi:hypothetical protein